MPCSTSTIGEAVKELEEGVEQEAVGEAVEKLDEGSGQRPPVVDDHLAVGLVRSRVAGSWSHSARRGMAGGGIGGEKKGGHYLFIFSL
jgi:hypothetical protein